MDELCSPQLLSSVRRMVLELTQHNDDSKEFVRFFHRQLGGILQVGRNDQSFPCELMLPVVCHVTSCHLPHRTP